MTAFPFRLFGVALLAAAAAFAQKADKEGKAWLDSKTEPAAVNVNGVWRSPDWGQVKLAQSEGSRDIKGTGDGWDINGVVSGKTVFLLFSHKGKVNYSAELAAEGNALKGSYANSLMTEKSKKRSMVLTK